MTLFITGTDTDVGKTRVTAACALALRAAGRAPTVVKLVQTGLAAGELGDAAVAGALAGCAFAELARFAPALDPWNAALHDGVPPVTIAELAARVRAYPEPVVVEGSGGAAVPLNARETLADAASQMGARAVLAVGMRLGCINHAALTAAYLRARDVPLVAAVLVERWGPVEATLRDAVVHALEPLAIPLLDLAYEPEPGPSWRALAGRVRPHLSE